MSGSDLVISWRRLLDENELLRKFLASESLCDGCRKKRRGLRVFASSRIQMEEQCDRLRGAIEWALGENGRFIGRGKNNGAFWWRKELRRRAALHTETELGCERDAKITSQQRDALHSEADDDG